MSNSFYRLISVFIIFISQYSFADCTNPTALTGEIVYNSDQKVFQYCANTTWKRMNLKSGSGTGPCNLAAGTLQEGEMAYFEDQRTVVGCAGNTIRPFGPTNNKNGWISVSTSVNPNSGDHSCGIKTDKTLWCWGANTSGRTGLNLSSGYTYSPTQVSGGGQWLTVRAGHDHTCGIKVGGTLWCWGSNGNGRTGLNTASGSTLVPTQVSGGGTWKSVDVGSHTCGLKSDNTLWCWGPNGSGQLGDGTTTQQIIPKAISGSDTWIYLDSGGNYTCGIKTGNQAFCWGSNEYGKTGVGTSVGSTLTPTLLNGGHSWKKISAGERDTCAIKTDDTIMCWGQTGGSSPAAVAGSTTYSLVDVGFGYKCAIELTTNKLFCWGGNSSGQLGDGTFTARNNPTEVLGGGTWLSVGGGWFHTCGVKMNGSLLCWGDSVMGETGQGVSNDSLTPITVSNNLPWRKISAGAGFTCGIDSGSSIKCWGSNGNYRTGIGSLSGNTLSPTSITGGGSWNLISTGNNHACGIDNNLALKCWGSNASGRTGLNTTIGDTANPTTVNGGGSWLTVSAGEAHTCGIKSDNSLFCWGNNLNGRTGLNTTAGNTLVPTQVSAGTFWKKVMAGFNHTCAINLTDQMYCWGANANGQIGDNTSGTDRLIPTLVSGGHSWIDLSVGLNTASHTCGIVNSGALRCWGSNANAKTGLNTTAGNTLSPTVVTGGGVWSKISTGDSHSCGIKSDGNLFCWGINSNGKTGFNTITGTTLIPTLVSWANNWNFISASYSHTCGISGSGGLMCWGNNGNYELTKSDNSILAKSPDPSPTACTSPVGKAGSLIYNNTHSALQYCNGSDWIRIGN